MVLSDMLFDAVGIESFDLDAATERLELEEDPDYQILCGQYQTAVAGLKLGEAPAVAEEEAVDMGGLFGEM